MENQTSPRTIAVLSYCTIIGWVIAMFLDRERTSFARFHIRQALGIHLMFFASGLLFMVPVLGFILGMALRILAFLLALIGLLEAIADKEKPVPIIGEQFQEWFRTV